VVVVVVVELPPGALLFGDEEQALAEIPMIATSAAIATHRDALLGTHHAYHSGNPIWGRCTSLQSEDVSWSEVREQDIRPR